jgi:tyrosyl-tRNA synthetase
MPLVTNSAGTKFGKTESGTVWLDAGLTSPYRFYQFWLNTDDKDVVDYLQFFTWLEQVEIESLATEVSDNPGRREAQRRLAMEVTGMVHGRAEAEKAVKAAGVLFGGDLSNLSADDLMDIFGEVPSSDIPTATLEPDGMAVVDLVADHTALVASRGEARRLLRGGGLRINNVTVADDQHRVGKTDAIDGRLLVLRKGKKSYHLIRLN